MAPGFGARAALPFLYAARRIDGGKLALDGLRVRRRDLVDRPHRA
jgi:hypothetical protein